MKTWFQSLCFHKCNLCRYALATCNVEGRRRYLLLEATRETMTNLLKFFEDGTAGLYKLNPVDP